MNAEIRAESSRHAWLMLYSVVLERSLSGSADVSLCLDHLRSNSHLDRIRSHVSKQLKPQIEAGEVKNLLADEGLLNTIVDAIGEMPGKELDRAASIWLELARHILQVRSLLNHFFDLGQADRDVAQMRKLANQERVDYTLLTKILDQYEKLRRQPRTNHGPAASHVACLFESLETFLFREGSSWPVNCLIALASVDGHNTWWDGPFASDSRFEPGQLQFQREQLAEFLIEQLPRQQFPLQTINSVLKQLIGATIQVSQPAQFPEIAPGWITNWQRRGGTEILSSHPYLIVAYAPDAPGQKPGQVDDLPSQSMPMTPTRTNAPTSPDFAELIVASGFAGTELPNLVNDYLRSNSENKTPVLLKTLDEFVQLQDHGKDQPARFGAKQLDSALGLLRQLSENEGFIIQPARWNYSSTWKHTDLTEGERVGMRLVFYDKEPGQIIRVRRFGLGSRESTIRVPEVSVSVGKLAPAFHEMRDILRESNVPGAEGIKTRLKKWLGFILHGNLEEEIKDFFVDFHGTLGEPWRREDPDNADRFKKAFEQYLQSQFGFRMFEPRNRSDHPKDWMNLVGNRSPQTGRVRRIIQPGLLDSQGKLMIPASVEVE